MKLEYYSPTFRNVLLLEVENQKTKGGIYIPSSSFIQPEDKLYQVHKVGKDCVEVKIGDHVKLMGGIRLESIPMEATMLAAETDEQLLPNYKWPFIQVMEQQIIGFFRPTVDASISNAPGSQSETSGSSKL